MECSPLPPYVRNLVVAISKGIGLVVVLPLGAAIIFSQSPAATIALITTTLVIEYGAAPIGIGLGLDPAFVLLVLTCVALGITLFLFDLFDTLGRAFKTGSTVPFTIRRESKTIKTPVKVRNIRAGSLCPHPRVLCMPPGLMGPCMAQGLLHCPHHGRFYCYFGNSDPCHTWVIQCYLSLRGDLFVRPSTKPCKKTPA